MGETLQQIVRLIDAPSWRSRLGLSLISNFSSERFETFFAPPSCSSFPLAALHHALSFHREKLLSFIVKRVSFHREKLLSFIKKWHLSENNGHLSKNNGAFLKNIGHFSKKDGHFSKNIGHFWKNLPRFSHTNSKARCTFVFLPSTTPDSSSFSPFSTRK